MTEGNEIRFQPDNVNIVVEISDTNFPVICPVCVEDRVDDMHTVTYHGTLLNPLDRYLCILSAVWSCFLSDGISGQRS